MISEPYLPDPNFERTVILLCEHDENGSFGFVINKQSEVKIADALEEIESFDAPLFIGGPVQKDSLHFIHRTPHLSEGGKKIVENVFWGGDFDELLFQINTKQVKESEIKFFLGYSGWSPGQLLDELEQRSWIVCKGVDADLIFDVPADQMWRTVLQRMGGKFKLIAGYPQDPRLN